MSVLHEIDCTQLHHGYLLQGDTQTFRELVSHVQTHLGEAEIHTREYDTFGIDESRALSRLAQLHNAHAQVFVFRIITITTEAQNALLKLFEEPPHKTHFFFCVPDIYVALPTLRSRMWLLADTEHRENTKGSDFLVLTHKERLVYLEPLIKERNILEIRALLESLEETLAPQKSSKEVRDALWHLMKVRGAVSDSSASLKPLLESVALVAPLLR